MTASVKTLNPARPTFLSTNIPFLEKSDAEDFSTCFQVDYKPFPIKTVEPCCPQTPAQVDHKDLRHVKEQLTETMHSYHQHPLPKITRTPRWTTLYTNFKMPTNPGEVAFLTTQSQTFCTKPYQPPLGIVRQPQSFKLGQQGEQLPESISRSTFTPHQCSPLLKPTAKHLEGFPTIKGDHRCCSFASQHNSTFRGTWGRAATPVDKQPSSVVIGEPAKTAARETTYTTSFIRPKHGSYKPPLVKKHLKLNLGCASENSWSSTSKEAFCYRELDPVVVMRRDPNSSSIPKGDTDPRRNRQRMSVTTNQISFSSPHHTAHQVYAPGTVPMTKSHVRFSSPRLSSLYYNTTAKEHFGKKDGKPAAPAIPLSGKILTGSVYGPNISTTKTDFIPLKICRQMPCPQKCNIRFPLTEEKFSTTYGDHYQAKPFTPA